MRPSCSGVSVRVGRLVGNYEHLQSRPLARQDALPGADGSQRGTPTLIFWDARPEAVKHILGAAERRGPDFGTKLN